MYNNSTKGMLLMNNILLVGAGAVGQVHGYKLAAQECTTVSYLIKPKYLNRLKNGMTLYDLNKGKKNISPITFTDYELYTSILALKSQQWDQVHFCLSSDDLHRFDLQALRDCVGENAVIVLLQPGATDYNCVTDVFDPAQVVRGSISVLAYQTPLPSDCYDVDGVAYWFPPTIKMVFTGSEKQTSTVQQTFQQAKIKSSVSEQLAKNYIFLSSLLMIFVTVLESNGWSFKKLAANSKHIKLITKASRTVIKGLEYEQEIQAPLYFRYFPVWALKLALNVVPFYTPFNLEEFVAQHFKKLSNQTRFNLVEYEKILVAHNVELQDLFAIDLAPV